MSPQINAVDLHSKLRELRRQLIEDLELDFPDAGTLALLAHVQTAITALDAEAVEQDRAREAIEP